MNKMFRFLLVLGLAAILGLILTGCAGQTTPPAPTSPPAPTAAAPTQAPQPTAAPTGAPTAAVTSPPRPSPTPVPFTATITGVGVNPHQNLALPRADDPNQTAKLMTSGLHVIPPGVPAFFRAGATGAAADATLGNFQWSLQGPQGSTAQIAPASADQVAIVGEGAAVFTPDVTGTYTITLTVSDNQGNTSQPAEMNVEVATYVGAQSCQGCHADAYNGWAETGHATFFTKMVNGEDFAPEEIEEYKTAGFGCARCHTVGYYNITTASTGGWWDRAVNVLKFDWPEEQIGTAGTFESLPEELRAVSNIQCENCHGPASNHNGDPAKIATSMRGDSCDQCHNDGHFHTRGEAHENSAHANAGQLAAANGRAECARCHSPGGFVDFVDGKPAEEQRSQVGEIACAVCHDPHDATNPDNLRVVGDVTGAPIEIKDQGKSAVCEECHNARNTAEAVVTDTPEFPHYSAAAEALNNAGGYDFGVEIPNSPHAMIGQQADPNGVKPGPCVACHMFTTPGGVENATRTEPEQEITDETNPGHNLVGSHSFNMVATRPNGEEVEHIEACISCHPGITTFNFPAKADYDGDSSVEGVQDEVNGLLALVRTALTDEGVEVLEGYPYFRMPENASTEIKGAIYNYRFVIGVIPTGEGRGAAAHNFKRSVALLQISYQRLTGQDVPGATLITE